MKRVDMWSFWPLWLKDDGQTNTWVLVICGVEPALMFRRCSVAGSQRKNTRNAYYNLCMISTSLHDFLIFADTVTSRVVEQQDGLLYVD